MMKVDESSLRAPARRAARQVALDLLGRVREERERLDHPRDDKALHDFRVAMRRLRSWLRAFRHEFDDTLAPKHERRLKRVARATGASRDLEVHLEWVRERRKTLRKAQRPGAEWLLERLNARKAKCDLELRRAVDSYVDRVTRRIEKAMTSYVASVVDREPRLARTIADLVRAHAMTLGNALGRVSTMGDRAEAHAARIAAKRLRYLLEPLAGTLADVEPLIEDLVEMQDNLGELRDAQLFGSEIAGFVAETLASRSAKSPGGAGKDRDMRDDAVPGLLAMSRRLRRTEETAFATIEESWLGGGADPLLARTASIVAALVAIGKQGTEIERKYLLKSLPAPMPPASVVEIHQGYVPGERLTERVRSMRSAAGVSYHRTIKFGSGIERVEMEEPTTKRVFDGLWALTNRKRVWKRRHHVEEDGRTWEIDEFLDRPLVLAEVELDDPSDVPPIPGWLEPVLDREVTDDDDFTNLSLAR
jgi:CHAD domain-containing protein/CYTH domain-containing protein